MILPLSNGHAAIIDDEDCERLRVYRYYPNTLRDGSVYACRKRTTGPAGKSGRRHTRQLSHDVLDLPQGARVWHLNSNRLDCRKENLRVQTGCVHYCPTGHDRKPYRAMITIDQRRYHLGYWPTEEWAREACERAAAVAASDLRGRKVGKVKIRQALYCAVGMDA